MIPEDGHSIVQRLLQQDEVALQEVRARIRKILGFRGYGLSPEDRQDLEQIVVSQIWQSIGLPNFNPDRFWGFVEVVTARRCLDHRRAQRAVLPIDEVPEIADSSSGPLRNTLNREQLSLARQTVSALSDECQHLIKLRVERGLSYSEIAALLDTSEGSLRVKFHRCIRRAQEILAEEEDPS